MRPNIEEIRKDWKIEIPDLVVNEQRTINQLIDYIDELENMPLVQTVVKLQRENEVLRESMYQALGGYMSMCPECDGLLPKHADDCALRKALEGADK